MAKNNAGRARSPTIREVRGANRSPDFREQDRQAGRDHGQDPSDQRPASSLYDVFISYAEADRAWVDGFLIDGLEAAGVRCQRETAFALGVPRLAEFEKSVRSSARILLVLSPAYFSSESASFVDLLAQTYGLETSTWPVIPLRLAPVELPPRLAMLTAIDAIDPDEREGVLDKLCNLFQRPIQPAPARPDCPYPGMRAFTLDDGFPFFGRDCETEELLQHLRQSRFLAVIGASGSGKSSLVFAGLVPKLRKTSLLGPGKWLVRSMRPGERPLAELARTLGGDPADPAAAVAHALEADPPATRLLLIVDQFEEVFAPGEDKSEPFCQALRGLLHVESLVVVLTVRADFFTELMGTPLWPQIKANRVDVGPLDEAGLRTGDLPPGGDGQGVRRIGPRRAARLGCRQGAIAGNLAAGPGGPCPALGKTRAASPSVARLRVIRPGECGLRSPSRWAAPHRARGRNRPSCRRGPEAARGRGSGSGRNCAAHFSPTDPVRRGPTRHEASASGCTTPRG